MIWIDHDNWIFYLKDNNSKSPLEGDIWLFFVIVRYVGADEVVCLHLQIELRIILIIRVRAYNWIHKEE